MKREEYCQRLAGISQKMYAKYDYKNYGATKEWRCYSESCLTKDLSRYDMMKKGPAFSTRNLALENIPDFLTGKSIVFQRIPRNSSY